MRRLISTLPPLAGEMPFGGALNRPRKALMSSQWGRAYLLICVIHTIVCITKDGILTFTIDLVVS